MKRIMIIGASGSGKSTLACALGGKLNLPVVHGDHFNFNAGWVQKPQLETQNLFTAAASQETWIIEGNYADTLAHRAERADAIIYLELGKWHRLRRVWWRTLLSYGRVRADVAAGCRERFDLAFHWRWVMEFDRNQKPKMDWFIDEWRDKKPVVILSSRKAVDRFLQNPTREIDAARPFDLGSVF